MNADVNYFVAFVSEILLDIGGDSTISFGEWCKRNIEI